MLNFLLILIAMLWLILNKLLLEYLSCICLYYYYLFQYKVDFIISNAIFLQHIL